MRDRVQRTMQLLAAGVLWSAVAAAASEVKLLNVSYDVTREFCQDYNVAFARYWKEKPGDVLLTFENEATLIQKQFPTGQLEVVVPPVSILAENPVVWVDKVVKKRGTEPVARAYLEYLYSDAGQELAAQHDFRPRNPAIRVKYADRFRPLDLFTWMKWLAAGRRRNGCISLMAESLTRFTKIDDEFADAAKARRNLK